MGVTAVAIAVGLLAALGTGGRAPAAGPTLRLWPVLARGVGLQWVPELLGVTEDTAFPAVLASSGCLVAFALANLRLHGVPVVLAGLVLNIAVIVANGGMPVRAAAVVDAGIVGPEEVGSVDRGSTRHLEGDDDVLVLLGDVLPVAPLREVVSIGDLVLAAGAGYVVFRLLRPSPGGRRTGRRAYRPDRRRDLSGPAGSDGGPLAGADPRAARPVVLAPGEVEEPARGTSPDAVPGPDAGPPPAPSGGRRPPERR